MSRRRRAEKREIQPDPVYGSVSISKFINKIMYSGKRSVARRIVYQAIEDFAEKIKTDNPREAFEQALENAKPSVEVKSRRVGGANYQVPVEIPPNRRQGLAMQWIIKYSREKKGRTMEKGLSQELADCFNMTGSTIKKKEDTHRMAEANKAFAHYKW